MLSNSACIIIFIVLLPESKFILFLFYLIYLAFFPSFFMQFSSKMSCYISPISIYSINSNFGIVIAPFDNFIQHLNKIIQLSTTINVRKKQNIINNKTLINSPGSFKMRLTSLFKISHNLITTWYFKCHDEFICKKQSCMWLTQS